MKRFFLILIVALFSFSFISAVKTSHYNLKNESFKFGEKLEYKLHYGFYTAGLATLKVSPKYYTSNGKTCYKFDCEGKTVGSLAMFVKVNDNWRSYVDTNNLSPQLAYRNINEGKYHLVERTFFNHAKNSARVEQTKKNKKKEKTFTYPAGSHDIVSAYYYLRNHDYSKMKIGDKINMNVFFEDENYPFAVIYEGKEKVKVKGGSFNCIKLSPEVPKNEFFNGKNSVFIWISDDKNKIPVRIEAEIFLGAIQVDLKGYSGLRNKPNLAK